jgi:hypothetical protein
MTHYTSTVILTALIKGEPLTGLARISVLNSSLADRSTALDIFASLDGRRLDASGLPEESAQAHGSKTPCLVGPSAMYLAQGRMGHDARNANPRMALVSSSDTDETLILREAYIKRTKPIMNIMDIVVKPGEIVRG